MFLGKNLFEKRFGVAQQSPPNPFSKNFSTKWIYKESADFFLKSALFLFIYSFLMPPRSANRKFPLTV